MLAKGKELRQRGTIVCASSVAIFAPVLMMMARRGINRMILYVLAVCWLTDIALGVWFIVRGRKLMQESESNG